MRHNSVGKNLLCKALLAALLLGIGPRLAQALTFTFAPGQYDNAENTVTGTNALPVYTNNQATGNFRDVIWWGRVYNGGVAGVGSPDFINANKNLISNGGSPARAVLGGNYDALNFTGQKTGSGGASFLTVYDKTPADDGTRNLFDASIPGGLSLSTDVLFVPGQHSVSAGLVALYSEGQNGLGLLVRNSGGNNPDLIQLDLVFQSAGVGTIIQSTNLGAGGAHFTGGNWYRIGMNVEVSGDTFSVTGTFHSHTTQTDPTSPLGSLITSVNWSGSLTNPGNAFDLTNPGEIGLMVMTTENFSDGLGQGGTGENPLTDSVGVSFTNFTFDDPTAVPEPSTLALASLGMLSVGFIAWRRARPR